MKAFKKALIAGLAAIAITAFATPALAGVVIDFGTGSAGIGGTITALGGGNYKGVGIPVGVMTVGGTLGSNGAYLTTGTAVGSTGTFASLDFDTSLNTITVTGGINGCATLGSCAIPSLFIAPGTVLLTGSFAPGGVVMFVTPPQFGAAANFNAFGPDTKDPGLLRALGLSTVPAWGYAVFNLATNWTGASGLNPSSGSGTVASTDLLNSEIPEPGSMVLLGTGLLGLVAVARRRQLKK